MNSVRSTKTLVLALALAAGMMPVAALASADDSKSSPKAAEPASPPANPRKVRPVRKPVIDLKKQAAERRPGQVMPGDPTPAGVPNTPPPAELQDRPIDLIDTSSAPRVELKPAPETTIAPRQQPQPEAASQPIAQPTAQPTEPLTAPPLQPEVQPAPVPVPVQTAPVPPAPIEPAPVEPAPAQTAPVQPAPQPEPIATNPVVVETAPAPAPETAPVNSMPEVRVVQVQPAPVPVPEQQEPSTPAPVAVKALPTRSAPPVTRGIVDQLSAPSSTGPIAASVKRAGPGIQWRVEGTNWSSPASGQSATGKIEIRCGLESEIELTLADSTTLRIQRLGRVIIEQSTEPDGRVIPSISLARGAIELIPSDPSANAMYARVKTPDRLFGVAAPLRVEYDAFSGTKRSLVNP